MFARRLAAALGLLVLAPMIVYDTEHGNPFALIAGLIFLAPLCGGAALLVGRLPAGSDSAGRVLSVLPERSV